MLKRREKGCFGAVRRSLIERRVDDMHTALHAHLSIAANRSNLFYFYSRNSKNREQTRTKIERAQYDERIYNTAFVGDYNDHSLRISPARMQKCIEDAEAGVSFLYRLRRYSIIRRKRTF